MILSPLSETPKYGGIYDLCKSNHHPIILSKNNGFIITDKALIVNSCKIELFLIDVVVCPGAA